MQHNRAAHAAITRIGMVSSIGHNVKTTCASLQAGITRPAGLPISYMDNETMAEEPLVGHPIVGVTDGFEGFARYVAMGAAALTDCLEYDGENHEPIDGIYMLLANSFYEEKHLDYTLGSDLEAEIRQMIIDGHREELSNRTRHLRSQLIPRLLEEGGLSIASNASHCVFGGPADFAALLGTAAAHLQDGRVRSCLVGAVDSMVDPLRLELLLELGLLHTSDRGGMFPGEAAAFCLLEAPTVTTCTPKAFFLASAVSSEACDHFADKPTEGRGLAQAIFELEKRIPDLRSRGLSVFANLNGDNYRANDFGNVLTQLKAAGFPADIPVETPAICVGDTGVAFGSLALAASVRGFTRGYNPAGYSLVLLSGDDTTRGAFVVGPPD